MQKVTYTYTGETQTFYFDFPYFEKNNIVVKVDNQSAPAYNVIGVKGGTDPDFPYTSGRVVFVKPLKKFQTITIERHLPLVRQVDFQPTTRISTNMLNQDMNYTLELLKDIKDEFDTFHDKYADIVDKESTNLLLEKIALVNQNIAKLAEDIAELDGITNIMDDIDELQESVANHDTEIGNLQTTLDDIVQNPTQTLPDYTATPVVVSSTVEEWHDITTDGLLHINFMTNNVISWLTVAIGNETDNINFTTQINADARGADVTYPVKTGQKFKLIPRGATITSCKIFPLC